MKRRLRAPSPALVIALIALFVALGGTSYAAIKLPKNSVGSKQLKKNAVTGVKIKNKAVTASKINTSGLTVPNATHATSADSATSATNATNATTAANATDLGGVAASGYVKNSGTIYIPTGHANWQQFNSTDNDKVSRFTDTQAFTATATGGESFRFDPITPSSLYGQKLAFSGVRMCYQASAAASITHVFLEINTEATSSPGTLVVLDEDDTARTDAACRMYSATSPVALSSDNQISIFLDASFTNTTTRLDLGTVTAVLQPTSTVAALTKAPGAKVAPGTDGSAPR
jgi:hypothetical protein